jgi:hypothetical protein
MAGVEIPEGFGQVTGVWQQGGQSGVCASSIGFRLTSDSFDLPDGEDLADAMQALIINEATDQTQMILVKVVARLSSGPIGLDFPRGGAGPKTQSCCSPQISVLIRKRTGLLGRQYRGRMYMPAPPEVDVESDGSYDSAALADMQSLVDGFVTDVGGIGSLDGLFLLHAEGSATPPTGLLPQPLGLSVEPFVATQRRRSKRGAI